VAVISHCAVNYLVTLAWGSIPGVHYPAACSKVHSTHDAAVAMAAAVTLPRPLVEPREPANTLAESAFPVSPNQGNAHLPLSCMPKDAHRMTDGARLRNEANRQQFQVALLEDCSFFAHLVLRHVRAGGHRSSCLLERDSPPKKLNVAKVSQTRPRSSSNILPRNLPVEERALQPEVPSSLLQTLWVEVGCRHAQTLVSEKECHEYREGSKPAL
jgi:hypothetical protein